MKNTKFKKVLSLIAVCVLIITFAMFALGSSSEEENNTVTQAAGNVDTAATENITQEIGKADTETVDNNTLGDYKVEIKSCRLAKDYEGKDAVIVTYSFSNLKNDDASSFMTSIEDNVYQNGVGLNESYILDDSYNYDSGNSTKEIKKGASIDVEIAYELNDNTTPIEVEVKEYFSWDEKVITKQFELK